MHSGKGKQYFLVVFPTAFPDRVVDHSKRMAKEWHKRMAYFLVVFPTAFPDRVVDHSKRMA
jgi:hypothetical protein